MSDKPGNRQLILRIPPSLEEELDRDAGAQKITVQTVVLRILGSHYGIDVPHPMRGRPRKDSE